MMPLAAPKLVVGFPANFMRTMLFVYPFPDIGLPASEYQTAAHSVPDAPRSKMLLLNVLFCPLWMSAMPVEEAPPPTTFGPTMLPLTVTLLE